MHNIASHGKCVNSEKVPLCTHLNLLLSADENSTAIVITKAGLKHYGFEGPEDAVDYLIDVGVVIKVMNPSTVVIDMSLNVSSVLIDPCHTVFLTPRGHLVEHDMWGIA